MKDDIDADAVIGAFVFGLLGGFLICMAILSLAEKSPTQMRNKMNADAVRLGYGEWIAGSGDQPEFRWKPTPKVSP